MKSRLVGLLVVVVVLTMALMLPARAEAAPAAWGWGTCAQWYTVGWGENLYRIALWHGTTVAHLQALNGLANPNYIRYGQTLCVSGYAPGGPHGPYGHGFWYTVRYGDTLYGLAARYGVSVWALTASNHIPYPNWIYAGQVLWIP
jgi:spore germination protein YaaH